MEKVKIGLIGLGLMGRPHAVILKKVEECDLVAAAEVDETQKSSQRNRESNTIRIMRR